MTDTVNLSATTRFAKAGKFLKAQWKRLLALASAAGGAIFALLKNINAVTTFTEDFVTAGVGRYLAYPPNWLRITALATGVGIFVLLIFLNRQKRLSLAHTLSGMVIALALFGFAWRDSGGGPDTSRNVLVIYDSNSDSLDVSVERRSRAVFDRLRDRHPGQAPLELKFVDLAGKSGVLRAIEDATEEVNPRYLILAVPLDGGLAKTLVERGRNQFLVMQTYPVGDIPGLDSMTVGLFLDPPQEAHACVKATLEAGIDELVVIHSPQARASDLEKRYIEALESAARPQTLIVRRHDTNDSTRAEELLRGSAAQQRKLRVVVLSNNQVAVQLGRLATELGYDIVTLSHEMGYARQLGKSAKIHMVAPWALARRNAPVSELMPLLVEACTELALELDRASTTTQGSRRPARELRATFFREFERFAKTEMQRGLGPAWIKDGDIPHLRFDSLTLRPALQ